MHGFSGILFEVRAGQVDRFFLIAYKKTN